MAHSLFPNNKTTLAALLVIVLLAISCKPQYMVYTPISSFEELPYPFPMKKQALANDITLAFADEGTGPEVLVFIHGLGSYAPAWVKNISALKQHYRCIAVDLPGYGKSSKGAYSGSMQFFADVIVELLDSLQLPQATLVGHSMGGQISMVAALKYPSRVKNLILAAPAGFETFNEGEKQWFREVFTPKAIALTKPTTIQNNFAYNFNIMPKDADFMVRDRIAMRDATDFEGYCYIIPKCVAGMVDEPVFDLLPEIKQPTLIIFGTYDLLIPNRFLHGGFTKKVAEAGHQALPNSQLELVSGVGHFVQFEGAAAFNVRVMSFMSSR